MPKTASTATSAHLGQQHSHAPAWQIAQKAPTPYLYGILRGPTSWYVSWYNHAAKWGDSNRRAYKVLEAFGGGRTDFDSVLGGLLDPDSVDPEAFGGTDPLWYPMGVDALRGHGGLWSRSVRWYFGEWTEPDFEDGRRWYTGLWQVSELVPITALQSLGVSVLNEGPQGLEPTQDQRAAVLDADMDLWVECCSLVKGATSPGRTAIAQAGRSGGVL